MVIQKSKYTEYSPYPIDVILFSKIYINFFIAGSYFLEIDNQRTGYLFLYGIDHTKKAINLIQSIKCDAILDMKWIPNSFEKFIVTTSTGTLSIYELSRSSPILNHIWTDKIFDSNTLILSISVSNTNNYSVISTSTGELCVFDLNLLKTMQKWKAHDLECWTTCYNIDSSIIFSGSDDCTFKIWDIRKSIIPSFTNTKNHMGGIISFLPFDKKLITGSFDDHIRLFDLRNPNKDVWKENIGSAWRLIQQSENRFKILGCLMYEGAKLFDLDISGNNKVRVIKEFKEHESIVYAGDWYNEHEVVTCSFYDKRICFW
ncbi:hypothetical protein PORY_002709 [Pneumocystis oryctolagi]|uniref:Uncharacterized protein n=1 Tax=Pneumocystis oryctolagi TaxID=42067 RepID=A0ACB7CA15_9ASCO|nr:hypothetical protein PORY_002709 [Pneumocystis oryctolagi]